MRGASARAVAVVVERVGELLDDGANCAALGEQLFALCGVLDSQPNLRRALSDPSIDADRRADLFGGLLSDFDDATVDVARLAVRQRWSVSRDLSDALEQGAISAYLAEAEAAGDLDELEDELFRFSRIVEADPELRDTLGDRSAPVDIRQRLVDELIGEQVGRPTLRLVRHAVTLRHRTVLLGLVQMQRFAAARRERLVAVVRVAGPLSPAMRRRLQATLTDRFHHDLQLNVIIDPDVLGGVRVSVGDHVIDGTVSTRLAEARRRLAG